MPSRDTERELIDVATSLEYAAQAIKQKNFGAAEPIYIRALTVLERVYGASDPDTIACLQSLGDIYYQTGRFAEAMPHYKRLVAIGEKVLGRHHPGVIEMVLRLASTYQQLGFNSEADALFVRASTMSSSLSALNNPVPEPHAASSRSGAGAANLLPPVHRQTDSGMPNAGNSPSSSSPRQTNSRMPGASNINEEPNPFNQSARTAGGGSPPKRRTSTTHNSIKRPAAKANAQKDVAKEDAKQALLIALRRSSGVVISFIVVGVLIFCGYMMLKVLGTSSTKPLQANRLKGSAYKTADGQVDLVFLGSGPPQYKIGSQSYACSVAAMGPDLMDFKDSILSSLLNKEIWFEETPFGLQREDGLTLYSKNGPEIKTVRQLDQIAKIANSWFLARREYPKQNGDIQLGELSQNAVSGRPETPSIDHLDAPNMDVQEFVEVPNSNLPLEKVLVSAGSAIWIKEAAPYPGGIHCLNAKHNLSTGDVREFFAHGFDRNGKLIASSKPGDIYLVGMTNGKPMFRDSIQPPKFGRPPKLCVVQLPPNTPMWFLHYFTPIMCLGFSFLCFMAGKVSQAQSQRSGSISTGTRLGYVFLFIGMLWIVSQLIP